MKKLLLIISILSIVKQGYTQSFQLQPIPSVTIPVTVEKMTNLVFPEPIQAGVKVSAEIIAQKVRGVDNVIEIKALRRHFTSTNLSVYGKDGQLYSFTLIYVEDSAVLNFRIQPYSHESTPRGLPAPIQLAGLPVDVLTLRETARQLEALPAKLHQRTRSEHLTLRLTAIYTKNSLLWLTFRLSNHSALEAHAASIRIYLQDRRKVRRRAIQEVDLDPAYIDSLPSAALHRTVAFTAAFVPFHFGKHQRLVCDFRALDGRMLRLTRSASIDKKMKII